MTDVSAGTDVGRIGVSTAGGVAVLRLDRPEKHNALSPEMLEELERRLIDLDGDRSVRVVVISAAGARTFCAGADIKRFMALEPLEMWARWTRRGQRVFDLLAALRQPTIAAVAGEGYGGGLELALACDLRIVADSAALGLSEVGLGTRPGWGGTGRLRDLVGAGRTKQMVFTGEPVSARTALDWGLANALVVPADVEATAQQWARRISSMAPIATQMAKQAIDGGDAAQRLEQVAAAATAYTADAREGLASFVERRTPEFHGG